MTGVTHWQRDQFSHDLLAVALDEGVHLRPDDQEVHAWAGLPQEDCSSLRGMLAVAYALETTAPEVVPSSVWRLSARHRLLRAVDAAEAPKASARTGAKTGIRFRAWCIRLASALAAVSFAGLGAVQASAAALPGDVLYPVKQVGEEIALRAAATDAARSRVLMDEAEARLKETTALVRVGRIGEATASARRYDDTIARTLVALESSRRTRDTSPSDAAVIEDAQRRLTAQAGAAIDLIGKATAPADELLDGATRGLAQLADPPARLEVAVAPTLIATDSLPQPDTRPTPVVSGTIQPSLDIDEPAPGASPKAVPAARVETAPAGAVRAPAAVQTPGVSTNPPTPALVTHAADSSSAGSSSYDDAGPQLQDTSAEPIGQSPLPLVPTQVPAPRPPTSVPAETDSVAAGRSSAGAAPGQSHGTPPRQLADATPTAQVETSAPPTPMVDIRPTQAPATIPPNQGTGGTSPSQQDGGPGSAQQRATPAPPVQVGTSPTDVAGGGTSPAQNGSSTQRAGGAVKPTAVSAPPPSTPAEQPAKPTPPGQPTRSASHSQTPGTAAQPHNGTAPNSVAGTSSSASNQPPATRP